MAKPTRSIQEINQDYFQTAAILGDLEWKMTKFPGQIEELKRKLRTIDNEMDELQKLQEKEKQQKLSKQKGIPPTSPLGVTPPGTLNDESTGLQS